MHYLLSPKHYVGTFILVIVSLVLDEHARTYAFTIRTNLISMPRTSNIIKLYMAKGGIHGKKTRMLNASKKKKTKNPNRPQGKHRKTSKRDRVEDGKKSPASKSVAPKPKLSVLGNTKTIGPPWQVMGEKDMKKNIAAEKLRRERINSGLDSSSVNSSMTQRMKADVSGSNRLISAKDRVMLKWKRFNSQTAPSELRMVGSYLNKELPPSLGVPEIALLGRSNVGKSSLLNRLVTKAAGDSARVGKTPGATASVNLYALLGPNKGSNVGSKSKGPNMTEGKPILGFADLPGFGYAKLSKETKESVEEAAERYLGKRRELALGVLLVDSRRVPSEDDRVVLAALFDMGVPIVVAATKSDKLKANEIEPAMKSIRAGLGLPEGQPLKVSGVTGEGVKELWRIILDACETRIDELKTAIEEGRDDGGVLRVLSKENDLDDFYDDKYEEGDAEEEYFDDDEDVVYDQGYDWVQNESSNILSGEQDYDDSFYDDEDTFIDDSDATYEWDEENKQSEKEFMKLKNLRKVVKDMELRGEI